MVQPAFGIRPIYPVVFIDAIHVKVRDGQVSNRPIYVGCDRASSATGCGTSGRRVGCSLGRRGVDRTDVLVDLISALAGSVAKSGVQQMNKRNASLPDQC